MKFDYVIGNPPYQEETSQKVTTNAQKSQKNIFHYFQIAGDEISSLGSVLIYPGGRWIQQSGKGLKDFGKTQINDVRLKRIVFYSSSKELFDDAADLSDGISIVIKDKQKANEGFIYEYHDKGVVNRVLTMPPENELLPLNPNDVPILNKIKDYVKSNDIGWLHDRILPRSLFGIESDFVYKNQEKVRLYNADETIDYATQIKLFTNDKPGKAGRATWFVADKSIINQNQRYIDEWQVIVSSANAGGQKRDSQLEVVDNHSAFGRSRVALGSFASKEEADHFLKYMQTYLVRYAFLMSDEALTTLGKYVPDIGDYSSDNELLSYSSDLNKQLFKLFDFSNEEIDYIKKKVDGIRKAKEMN